MTSDPYTAPTSPAANPLPDTPHDLRWRGALWFAAPMFVLLAGLDAAALFLGGPPGIEQFSRGNVQVLFEQSIALLLPAAIAGNASGRRCRSTTWPRFLLLTLRDAMIWALYGTFLLWLDRGGGQMWEAGASARRVARAAMLILPITLLLAASMRACYHRRK